MPLFHIIWLLYAHHRAPRKTRANNEKLKSARSKCNVQQQTPSVEKHAHPPRPVVYCAYAQRLLDSQSFEFEICILKALNMPLIRCTNVFFQGRLSRHSTTPSEKTRLESWPRNYMGKATPVAVVATKCNVQPRQATTNPVGGKACSSTKGG